MTDCIENGAPKLRVEAMQTVMPLKPTDPRHSRRVSVPGNNHGSAGSFRRRFHMVLCYNKADDNDSGWIVAGWIKESLSCALVEHPVLAGRLRKIVNDMGRDGSTMGSVGPADRMEIVSNDCGVRLVEAQIDMSLGEFLDFKHKKDVESELVFWEDVQESTPQYSPLFYIQVTNFKCGGYSIGISCSLFLADPFSMTSFLKKWSKIHTTMVSKTDEDSNKIPIFYLPNLRKQGSSPTISFDSSTTNNHHPNTKTIIFKIPSDILNNSDKTTLVAKCIEEAEKKVSKRLSKRFTMFLKDSSEDVKVESCLSTEDVFQKPFSGLVSVIDSSLRWEDLGADKICFKEDNKAVYFSCWISSIFGEDFVMIVPSTDEGRSGHNIIVTVSD